MKLETKTIETKRLILRQFQIEDAADMYRNYASDPLVTKYLTWPTYTEENQAVDRMQWMREQYEKCEPADWAIELKELEQVVGSIGIVHADEAANSVEIGYCIGSRWWHMGITSEAFAAVIEYLFTAGEINRIEARHDPNNPSSGGVMKKCGLLYEGISRQSDWNNQGICDAAHYAILKEDWLKGKTP